MTKNRETRRREIRAATIDGKPGVTLHAITTGVVDDYGSFWAPDAFDESLGRRLPTLCWAHDWSEPLGPAVSFRAGDNGPEVDFVFSDFDAVPMARRAHTQVHDGTIRDCSVGFWNAQRRDPTDEERSAYPGIREVITRADLDEVSLVLRGAVPGAKVLAVRSGAATIDMDAFMEIARRKAAGELTDAEAKAAVGLLADEAPAVGSGADPGTGDGAGGEPDPPGDAPSIDEALETEADLALALIDRSAPGVFAPARSRRFRDLMAGDVREMLRNALVDKFKPGDNQWLWVRDHTDEVVIFDMEGFDQSGAFRLSYSVDGGKVKLTGDPVAVTVTTKYVEA